MTGERLRITGLSDDENATVNRLLAQLNDRQLRNQFRASLYDGKHMLRQTNSIIPPHLFKLGMVLGWSAKAVDMLARRCNPSSVVWADGDLNSIGYREFADANQLRAQINAGVVSSLIHGIAFLINTRGDVDSDEPASLLHVKDAMNATGDWSNRRRRLDNLLSVTSRDGNGKTTGLVLYLDGVTIEADRTGGKWVATRTQHSWGVPVEALVYKPRPGREFGSSRISRPLISIHERALRAVVRMEGHMDIYSIPQLVLLGAGDSIFKNPDGSYKAAWQIALGRIFGVPDDPDRPDDPLARADVKQFQAASPSPHIENLKELAAEFSGEASIPLTSLGVSDQSNPTSADSYIASREDLIAEAEGATEDWSVPLRRAIVRGLAIQNGIDEPPEWATIEQKWRSPIYLSRAAEADAGAKQLAAAPEWLKDTEVGLELLGLNEQQVRRALAEKRRAEGRRMIAALAGMTAEQVPSGDEDADQSVTAS